MKSVAYVVGVQGSTAQVVLGSHLECKQCGACIATLGNKERNLEAVNDIGAAVGQRVEVEIAPRHAVGAAFLLFVMPVISALVFGFVGAYLAARLGLRRDLGGIGLGIAGFSCSFLLLRYIDRTRKAGMPRIVKLLGGEEPPEGRC
jgi:sigma-E factor negative regulatory protein RseC